ncbi:hypothetical protein [Tenacibaculum agarivorans]|uniref:hypothetical protein n=1 Tax=Tenacibaculum agarivorans TaxID=1908389 RepID=UPI00117FDC83|nr:hypothetical protein [Tenacibaculum agarivorans]
MDSKKELAKEENTFNTLKDNLTYGNSAEFSKKLVHQDSIITSIKEKMNNLQMQFSNYKVVCSENNLLENIKIDTMSISKDISFDLQNPVKEATKEPITFSYFNEDIVIVNSIIPEDKQNTLQAKIFNQVLKQTQQETYFGDITIPEKNQEFYFYSYKKVEKKKVNDKKKANESTKQYEYKLVKNNLKKYKFKKIQIEIRDGNFFDIQVQVEYNGKLLWFENQKGLNFLKINKLAKRNFLFYLQKEPDDVDEQIYEELRLRLSDVFMYKYKMGNNYIPHDLVIELPKEDINSKETNAEAPATYQIKQDTYLDKIIELRAYTDFFSLFGDSNNGLVQIEGNAKFYIFPFPYNIGSKARGQLEFFKSITPHVHYAKLDDDSQNVNVSGGVIDKRLELIEKKFLNIGANLNVIEFYHKNYPMKASLYGIADYNITKAKNDAQAPENLKSLSLGAGLEIASNRLNNFGFNYRLSMLWYDYKSFNTSTSINTDFGVPVISNQAEIFYHPNENPNQAIFVRLATNNFLGERSNEAFYQFQFGYKFSIGSRTVKK